MKSPLSPNLKPAYGKIATILGLILILGLGVVLDYGVAWEEGTAIAITKYNLERIISGQPIPADFRYQGVWFNLLSEFVFQIKEFITEGVAHNPRDLLQFSDNNSTLGLLGDASEQTIVTQEIYQRIQIKHILTFLSSLVAYASLVGIVSLLAGIHYAWFAPIILALFPRFWAHSFYDSPQILLAALFTLGTLLSTLLVHFYLTHSPYQNKTIFIKTTLYSLGYGCFLGLLTGAKISGILLILFVIIAHLITRFHLEKIEEDCYRYSLFYLLIILAWFITSLLLHPAAWSNPTDWFTAAFPSILEENWARMNLFRGELIKPQDVPWYYLPVWLFLTLPSLWQGAFLLGLIFMISNYNIFSDKQRICTLLILLQIGGFLGLGMFGDIPLYHGMHQFLVILPAIAAIVAVALIWGYQKLYSTFWQFISITLFVFLLTPICLDMVTLHPYQGVYFNRLSGGLPNAYGEYDTDYEGVSLQAGIEWLNEQTFNQSEIVLGGPQYIGEILLNPDLTLLDLEILEEDQQPDYYLAMPYLNLQQLYPDCPIIYSVTRQGVPLSIVKKCQL
ncbi:hypothetical protein PN462_18825 [Spirulina sp. CS-785/01]|uniref:hypothetical protein n=1 Tax=Spirulina sp. CS-785/01 TaxID=3021716 RepID=UPI00232FFCE1|nr:hypothetical protein [Spirulina sp. CS-785/01]MDB9315176.1 hypothetical protein [Spirulina sp. CS-785/01]